MLRHSRPPGVELIPGRAWSTRPLLWRLFDPNLHRSSQDAVESVLRPQEPTGIVGTGRTDFGAHYMDGALDLDSHAGFESVHTLFSPACTSQRSPACLLGRQAGIKSALHWLISTLGWAK